MSMGSFISGGLGSWSSVGEFITRGFALGVQTSFTINFAPLVFTLEGQDASFTSTGEVAGDHGVALSHCFTITPHATGFIQLIGGHRDHC